MFFKIGAFNMTPYAQESAEVYNRNFWDTLFIYNFQINKKAYLQTLKFLPIPQTFPMTPFILKIIMLKKDTYKPQTPL